MARRDSLNPRNNRGSRPRRGTNRYFKNSTGRVKRARIDTNVPTPRLPRTSQSRKPVTTPQPKPPQEWQEAKAGYRKQYNRINSFIKRAEKRGYTFDKSSISMMVPPISEITPNSYSTNRIINLTAGAESLTPDVLYGFATAESSVTGETISGTERRQEERQESAQRAKHTREIKKQYDEFENEQAEKYAEQELGRQTEEAFQEEQRQRDVENIQRLNSDQRYRQMFTIGQVVYRKIRDMLEKGHLGGMYAEAWVLEGILDEEIEKYGEETVYLNIAQFDNTSVLHNAEVVIFDSGQTNRRASLAYLTVVIRGNLMTAEDAKRMGDAADADAYTDTE